MSELVGTWIYAVDGAVAFIAQVEETEVQVLEQMDLRGRFSIASRRVYRVNPVVFPVDEQTGKLGVGKSIANMLQIRRLEMDFGFADAECFHLDLPVRLVSMMAASNRTAIGRVIEQADNAFGAAKAGIQIATH